MREFGVFRISLGTRQARWHRNCHPCFPLRHAIISRLLALYSREFLARATGELQQLPPGAAIEQMLADYHVMRDQVRACAAG